MLAYSLQQLTACLQQLTAGQQQLTAGQEQLTALVGTLSPLLQEATLARQKRLNPWCSDNRSKAEQTEFKDGLLKYYGCAVELEAGQKQLWARCMISDQVLPRPVVIASHIWKHCTYGAGLDEFGLKFADVNNSRNGLLMCSEIEKQFDDLRVAFSYDLLTDKFTFHVLDCTLLPLSVVDLNDKKTKNALSGYPALHDIQTFGNLDRKVMLWTAPALPYRRVLAWHYALAVTKHRRTSASAPASPDPSASPPCALPEPSLRSPGWDKLSPEAKWPEASAMELYDHAVSRSQRDAAEEEECSSDASEGGRL